MVLALFSRDALALFQLFPISLMVEIRLKLGLGGEFYLNLLVLKVAPCSNLHANYLQGLFNRLKSTIVRCSYAIDSIRLSRIYV